MVTVGELDERLVTKTVMDKTRTVPHAGDGAVRLPPGEHWHPRRTRDFKSVPEQADAGAKQGPGCHALTSTATTAATPKTCRKTAVRRVPTPTTCRWLARYRSASPRVRTAPWQLHDGPSYSILVFPNERKTQLVVQAAEEVATNLKA